MSRLVSSGFQLCFWIPLVLCTYLALAPSPPKLPVFKLGDVVLHAAAFVYLTYAFLLAFDKRPYWQAFVWLSGYGIFIELVQSQEVERSAEWKDLGVDLVGIAVGLLLARYSREPVRRLATQLAMRFG